MYVFVHLDSWDLLWFCENSSLNVREWVVCVCVRRCMQGQSMRVCVCVPLHRRLNLSDNRLSGDIPTALGSLTHIE